jgi:hypothetical protein
MTTMTEVFPVNSLKENVSFLTTTEARFDRDYRCNPRTKTFSA